MQLISNNRKSEFFSVQKMKADSIFLSGKEKGIYGYYRLNDQVPRYRIIKYADKETLDCLEVVGSTAYMVEDKVVLDWQVLQEFETILGHRVQKATTHFRGRQWIAWFASDIPISDGPYKFKGLPGLILKVEDTKNQHTFECIGSRKLETVFIYPELFDHSKEPRISYVDYQKKWTDFRGNPAADLIGKIPDQQDAYGNLKTGMEIWREV